MAPVKGKNFREYTPLDLAEARANGISYLNFRNRIINLGWSVKKAKTVKVRKESKYGRDMLKLAESNGVNYTLYTVRIKHYNWDPLEAATTPPTPQGKYIRVKGKMGGLRRERSKEQES